MRIVTMNAFLPGYAAISAWAERNGHEIVLVVTLPTGASDRYDPDATPFVLELPRTANVLVTAKLRTIAVQVIASLEPDLVISAAFPRLIPGEILTLPKYGAVNVHPSPLPAGRGPNPVRLVYEGATTVAATLHRTEAEFDTGAILAQRVRPLPDELSGPAIFGAWREMIAEVLDEGTARAFAGDPGIPQDPALASEAPMFTPEEHVLSLVEPTAALLRKIAALNFVEPKAHVVVEGTEHRIRHATAVASASASASASGSASAAASASGNGSAPGEVLEKHGDGWTVRTADGVVRLFSV